MLHLGSVQWDLQTHPGSRHGVHGGSHIGQVAGDTWAGEVSRQWDGAGKV